jgi:NAD(P)-dependent dehydrogenase (short-subunit alcohol dehydrogenase family)
VTGRRICILGGCGGIGRGLVSACLANDDAVAVLDLKTSLARHPPPAGIIAVEIDGIMFPLGPLSAYMTGQTLWVNGGAYMP